MDSPEFDKIYRERLPKLIEDKVLVGTVEDFMNNPATEFFNKNRSK